MSELECCPMISPISWFDRVAHRALVPRTVN